MLLLFYITFPDEAAARKTADLCVEKKLAACALCFPAQSRYFWEGQMQQEGEWVALLKTLPAAEQALETAVLSLHPYDIPCILRWPVAANASYQQWVEEQITGAFENENQSA